VLLTTEGLLEELFLNNPDGWGAMYHTSKGVKALKLLPASVEDTRKYVQNLPNDNRLVALHWRWRTSGLVDQANAHPHKVQGGWLIHNGVLSISTDTAPEMCDTHHYIRAYLDGSVAAIIKSKGLQQLIGEHIGNNRFVLLSDSGEMCIINEHQGYRAQGLWFANTYSMSRGLVDASYTKPVQYAGFKSYPKASWYDDIDSDPSAELEQVLHDQDVENLAYLLEDSPSETLDYIYGRYSLKEYVGTPDEDLTAKTARLRDDLLKDRRDSLVAQIERDTSGVLAEDLAQCILWWCVLNEETVVC